MVIWNSRRTGTPFLDAYEDFLLEHGTDYPREIANSFSGPAAASLLLPSGTRCPYDAYPWSSVR